MHYSGCLLRQQPKQKYSTNDSAEKKEQNLSLAILKGNQNNNYKDSRHLETARCFSTNK